MAAAAKEGGAKRRERAGARQARARSEEVKGKGGEVAVMAAEISVPKVPSTAHLHPKGVSSTSTASLLRIC